MRRRHGCWWRRASLFGLGYPLAMEPELPPPAMIAVKGAGVGLLAIAAACARASPDGWLLAAVLALGAAGDVLLEIDFAAGAAAFAAGHVVAIMLYLRNRRAGAGLADRMIAALLLIGGRGAALAPAAGTAGGRRLRALRHAPRSDGGQRLDEPLPAPAGRRSAPCCSSPATC